MTLRSVGPIGALDWRDPSATWQSEPGPMGTRNATISGVAKVAQVQQLGELVANSDLRITYGGHSGVLVYIDFTDDALVGPNRGWYLLDGFSKQVEHRWSMTPYTRFSLSATYLPNGVELVLTRSSRQRANVHGLIAQATVVDPFRGTSNTDPFTGTAALDPFIPVPSGATQFTRDHDPTTPHSSVLTASGRPLVLYARSMSSGTDPLPGTVIPAPYHAEAHATGVRGADVRVYDRGVGQEVYGPSHGFRRSSDILVTNGLLRFRVGNRGIRPYLNVEAFRTGEWRAEGSLILSGISADVLRGARLVRCTPEEATVDLTARNVGDISVTLRRGARGIDVHHGAERPPYASASRTVLWQGMPPTYTSSALSSGTGKFGQGFTTTTGYAQWAWPWDLSTRSWCLAGWWLPSAASASQANSGLVGIVDLLDMVASVTFTASDKKLRFNLGAASVVSDALSFSANAPIFWAADFDDEAGMGLTVRVGSTTTHYAGVSTDPVSETYHSFASGEVRTPYGSDPYGDGPYGGSTLLSPLNGVLDNLMLFDGRLTPTERATLALGTHRFDGLPSPEGRLVWHAPFDTTISPLGSSVSSGRRYQATAENGSTRQADAWGLTKALASLNAVSAFSPFGLSGSGNAFDFYAYLASTGALDDLADHHAQFAAANSQEVRVR